MRTRRHLPSIHAHSKLQSRISSGSISIVHPQSLIAFGLAHYIPRCGLLGCEHAADESPRWRDAPQRPAYAPKRCVAHLTGGGGGPSGRGPIAVHEMGTCQRGCASSSISTQAIPSLSYSIIGFIGIHIPRIHAHFWRYSRPGFRSGELGSSDARLANSSASIICTPNH